MAWISTTRCSTAHAQIYLFRFACIDLQFCRLSPDPCCIINHGLAQLRMRISIFFSFTCISLKFCRLPPDPCHIIDHGLDLNYKVCNCAHVQICLFLVLHISTWNFLHTFLVVLVTSSQAWVCSFHTKVYGNCTATLFIYLFILIIIIFLFCFLK